MKLLVFLSIEIRNKSVLSDTRSHGRVMPVFQKYKSENLKHGVFQIMFSIILYCCPLAGILIAEREHSVKNLEVKLLWLK